MQLKQYNQNMRQKHSEDAFYYSIFRGSHLNPGICPASGKLMTQSPKAKPASRQKQNIYVLLLPNDCDKQPYV